MLIGTSSARYITAIENLTKDPFIKFWKLGPIRAVFKAQLLTALIL